MWGWISAVIFGLISISAFESNKTKLAIIFNSLCLGSFVFIVFYQQQALSIASMWIIAGLVVSFIADFLRIQHKKVKLCFIAFLAVQLLYSKAYWIQLSGPMIWWLPALLFAASIVTFFLLLPQLDTLIFPVIIMGMMLLQMSWASGEVWINTSTQAALLGFMGCLCFMISALILAIHDYRHPLRGGYSVVNASYLIAQGLIVASVI